jgi:hypothetical protein
MLPTKRSPSLMYRVSAPGVPSGHSDATGLPEGRCRRWPASPKGNRRATALKALEPRGFDPTPGGLVALPCGRAAIRKRGSAASGRREGAWSRRLRPLPLSCWGNGQPDRENFRPSKELNRLPFGCPWISRGNRNPLVVAPSGPPRESPSGSPTFTNFLPGDAHRAFARRFSFSSARSPPLWPRDAPPQFQTRSKLSLEEKPCPQTGIRHP